MMGSGTLPLLMLLVVAPISTSQYSFDVTQDFKPEESAVKNYYRTSVNGRDEISGGKKLYGEYKFSMNGKPYTLRYFADKYGEKSKFTISDSFVMLRLIARVATAGPKAGVQILRYKNDNDGFGRHRYAYDDLDFAKLEKGNENRFPVIKGKYAWVSPDRVAYIFQEIRDQTEKAPSSQPAEEDDDEKDDDEEGPGVDPSLLASMVG